MSEKQIIKAIRKDLLKMINKAVAMPKHDKIKPKTFDGIFSKLMDQ